MEEAMELIYRIQTAHRGRIAESEAREEFGPWVTHAAERAGKLSWLVAKGSPVMLVVTYGGRKALDAALASKNAIPPPHWLSGSIPWVQSPTGAVIPPPDYQRYKELQEWALQDGVLTQEDLDRVERAPKKETEEPENYRMLDELSFPGTRGFAVSLGDEHALNDPAGHEGPYQVAAILTRRGSPDIPFVYVTDANSMEGDSHLWLPEERRDDGLVKVYTVVHTSLEDGDTVFELVANKQGRLGQIRTVLRAQSAVDARRKAYRLLNPFLCDLSYRYEVPTEILQMNVVELATLTVSGMKQDDFRMKLFDPEEFFGSGLDYRELFHYEFFTRLYREGANLSSVDYGFLCFFRIAEGLIRWRRERVAEEEGKSVGEVARTSVFEADEIVAGDEASLFPDELQGASLWEAYKHLEDERAKVGHAFLNDENPLWEYDYIMSDRLKAEEQAGTRRAKARYVARRMLQSEFFHNSSQSEDAAIS